MNYGLQTLLNSECNITQLGSYVKKKRCTAKKRKYNQTQKGANTSPLLAIVIAHLTLLARILHSVHVNKVRFIHDTKVLITQQGEISLTLFGIEPS